MIEELQKDKLDWKQKFEIKEQDLKKDKELFLKEND